MTGLVYLDIAIGIIFLVLVFSLFAGAIQEAVSAIFNLRAKSLREGIFRMLGSDESEFQKFWKTPLIESLKGPTWAVLRVFDGKSEKDKRNPSAIPTDTFVKSILFRVREELDDISPNDAAAFLAALRERGKQERAKLKALNEKAEAARKDGKPVPEATVDELPNPLILRIDTVLEGVSEQAAEIETTIGLWYHETRDRFAGWYIRRTQAILFIIGLSLAIMTNTDPIRYGIELYSNDALRQKVVQMAEEVAAMDDLGDVAKKLDPTRSPLQDQATLEDIHENILDRSNALSDRLEELEASGGWSHCGPKGLTPRCFGQTIWYFSDARERWKEEAEVTGTVVTYSPLGWLLLALGVMLGAQFWMDMLNRFVSIRSAGTALLEPEQKKPKQEDTNA